MSSRFNKIAKKLVADYGDVQAYHNVNDYFKSDEKLEHDSIVWLSDVIEDAILETEDKRHDIIVKAIKSNRKHMEDLDRHGVEFK